MHGVTVGVPQVVIDDINSFIYQERMGLSSKQMDEEPKEAIDRAVLLWGLFEEASKANPEQ